MKEKNYGNEIMFFLKRKKKPIIALNHELSTVLIFLFDQFGCPFVVSYHHRQYNTLVFFEMLNSISVPRLRMLL